MLEETPRLAAFRQALAAMRAAGPVPIPEDSPENPHRRRLNLILECDYRFGPSIDSAGCQCLRVCTRGQGTLIPGSTARSVSLGECLACVTDR